MKLKRIELERVDGLPHNLEINLEDAPLTVVLGPNGSGKSTLVTALARTLWPDARRKRSSRRIEATSFWQRDGEQIEARLSGGEVTWRCGGEGRAPYTPLADLEQCYALSLRDLLAPAGNVDTRVAESLQRELLGGFDLVDARRVVVPPSKRERQQAERELRRAEQHRRGVEEAQQELAKSEESRRTMELERQESDRARVRLDRLEAASERLEAIEERDEAGRRAAAMGQAVLRVSESDPMRAEELSEDRDRVQGDLAECQRSVETAVREIEGLGLGDRPIAPELLAALDRVSNDLRRIRDAAEASQAERDSAREREQSLLGEMGFSVPPTLSSSRLQELQALIDREQEARREWEGTRARLGEEPAAGEDPSALQEGMAALSAWLRAPEARNDRRSHMALVLAAIVAGLGFAGTLWHPALALFGLAGVALVVLGFRGSRDARSAESTSADRARERFEDSGVAVLDAWTNDDVMRCLDALTQRLVDARENEHQRRTLDDQRHQLENLEQTHRRTTENLSAALEALGMPSGLGELPVRVMAQQLMTLHQAREVATLEERACEERWQRVRGLEERLRELLRSVGYSERQATVDDAVTVFRARSKRLAGALERRDAGLRELARLEPKLDERQAALESFYRDRDLQPEDEAGLGLLMEKRERYLEFSRQRDELDARVAAIERRLADAGDVGLLAFDRSELDEERRRTAALAARHEDLSRAVARLDEDLRRAKEGNDVSEMLTRCEELRLALVDLDDREIEAAAAAFLLDEVEAAYERELRPRVLRETEALFAEVTKWSYRLELAREGTARLLVRETGTGATRELEELSEGTRAQLLLAARLAHAQAQEDGNSLPFFLDEALATADPERFRELGTGLLEITRSGRQLIYLTSDPSDLLRWQEVCRSVGKDTPRVIDLLRVRQEGQTAIDPALLNVEHEPDVPAPEGRTVGQYAAVLNVLQPRPFENASSWHVLYALPEELEVVHELVKRGVTTIGRLSLLLEREPTFLSERQRAHARGSVRLVTRFVAAWERGRGRPVDPAALKGSQAVSDRFFPELEALLAEVEGDANRLMEALDAGKVPSFGARKRRRLEEYLAEQGCLDLEPVWTEQEIRDHLFQELFEEIDSGRLSYAQMQAFVSLGCRALGELPAESRT